MNELALLTTEEAKSALANARLAVLPVGSLEQHGPHLPLDTDAAVADALARRIAKRLGDEAILCPIVGYGLSEHHLGFAGTLTLRPATFMAVVEDVIASLHHHGIDRVLIVNGHGGNIEALRLVARQVRRDTGVLVASVMWAVLAADVAAEVAAGETYGHACEVETSVALALFGDRVRLDMLDRPREQRSHDEMTDPPGGLVDEPVWFQEWTTDGAIGLPSAADAAGGKAIVDTFVDRAVAYARRMVERSNEDVT